MDIQNMKMEDILGLAVRTEILGRNFYLKFAEKITHPEVKKRILALADDEKRHQALMENLYRTMVGKEPAELPQKGVPDILRAIASLEVGDKTQVIEVIDMAIEAEATSTKFYQRGAAIATEPKLRRIFEELEKEEEGHYNYLQSEKAALSGDLYWFSISDTAALEE